MAKLAVVKKQTQEEILAELIDQYADLSAQGSEIEKARKGIRKDILSLMPAIPEGEKSIEIATDNAIAKLVIGENTEVIPQSLFAKDPNLFWLLAKVPVGALRTLVSGEDFREITRIVQSQVPELTVRRKQD